MPNCDSFGFHVENCSMVYVFRTSREYFDQIIHASPGMYEISGTSGEFQKVFPNTFIAGQSADAQGHLDGSIQK